MNDGTPQHHDRRTDIRTLDRHHGRHEVYHALDAVAGQNHTSDEEQEDEAVDLNVAEPPRDTGDDKLREVTA
jgi:hypothetical protein